MLRVGNQLPILLIDFEMISLSESSRWESVTDPLDRLQAVRDTVAAGLGISYRSS